MRKYELKIKIQDEGLVFVISGQIDSMNAPDLKADFDVVRNKCNGGNVVFDCNDLSYISSAGLRFFLHVSKHEQEKIRLINVSPYVYERFAMAGFTEFFSVEKSLREILEEEVQKVGKSGDIEIYQTKDDLLLKVYPDNTVLKDIEFERKISHAAFAHDIPTLISYDIVKYQDRYGLLYEHLETQTVAAAIKENPEKEKYYAVAMGRLLKQIHSFTPNIPEIPQVSDLNKKLVQGMTQWFSGAEIDALLELINAIRETDTMLYYWFNPESVFIQNGELILINMTNIRIGNPLHDFARAYRPYQKRAEFWKDMLHSYFGTGNIKRKEKAIEAASLLGVAFQPASHKFFSGQDMKQERIDYAVELARRELFPNVKKIASLFAQYK